MKYYKCTHHNSTSWIILEQITPNDYKLIASSSQYMSDITPLDAPTSLEYWTDFGWTTNEITEEEVFITML